MMNTLSQALRQVLPALFLLTAVSWLFAPAYYHDHYGSLQFISSYESGSASYSWLFRDGDIVASLLLLAALWLYGIWHHDRRLAWLVFATAVLSAIDGIFENICVHASLCSGAALLSSRVHDFESVILVVVILVLAVYHGRRYQQALSYGFVIAQVLLGALAISGLLDKSGVIALQYAYELLVLSWLAWLMAGWSEPTLERLRLPLRRAFALWTVLNGTLAIVVPLTHRHGHILGPLFDVSLAHTSLWVGEHSIIAGVLMLYLARHVYQGQRRAAWLLLMIFASQVIKYSVISPVPFLLGLNLLSFVILLYARPAFDRNVLPLPITSRLKDVAILVSGVALALLISLILTGLLGHGHAVRHDVHYSYQRPARLAQRDKDRLEHDVGHSHVVGETLLIATLSLMLWSLFRPARFYDIHSHSDRQRAETLLGRYGTSTEDYFKLWPTDKSYYFAANGDGFVAYRVVGTIAFALADPVAELGKQAALRQAFQTYCRKHGWAACFLAVPETSLLLYGNAFKTLKIGSAAVINVATFSEQTSKDKWWRWQRNRAGKAGLNYQLALPPHSSELLAELQIVSNAWLQPGTTQEHREQGFALGYFDTDYLQACRLHLLRSGNRQLVAFANELPVYGAPTQRSVDLIRYLPGQNGTMPFLLSQVLAQLQSEGQAKTFDLGFVPLAGLESSLVTVLRRLASSRFSSLGLEQFKNKFDPQWQTQYLAYDGDILDLARIAASLETLLKKPD